MTTAFDYVERGQARWPEKSRLDKAMRYFSVYLQSIQGDEDSLIELLDAFANWYRPGLTFSFVLDIVGNNTFGQPRPASFDDENYRLLLLARSLVRVSRSTKADVTRVIDYLASINGGQGIYSVFGGPMNYWTINIFDVVLDDQWAVLYPRLIFDTIGAVDGFELNINNNGVGIYDDESQLYDVALYS